MRCHADASLSLRGFLVPFLDLARRSALSSVRGFRSSSRSAESVLQLVDLGGELAQPRLRPFRGSWFGVLERGDAWLRLTLMDWLLSTVSEQVEPRPSATRRAARGRT